MIRFYRTNKQRKSCFILSLSLFLLFGTLSLEGSPREISEKVDRAKLGQAQSYNNLSRSAKSLPLLEELLQKYPKNGEVVIEYIRALLQGGDTAGARIFLRQFLADYNVKDYDLQVTMRMIEFSGLAGLYDEGIGLCRRFLSAYAENQEAGLWLARLLSWDQRYPESIEMYSRLIAANPGSLTLAREKARVLGWDRQYGEALKMYQRAADAFSDSAALKTEMTAKRSFYRFHDLKAAEYYEQWLALEPDHPEALFDLAQVYSRQRQWTKAKALYEKVLEQIPDHPQANAAYQKLRVLKESQRMRAGYTFFEADSGSRQTDKRRHSLFEELTVPVTDKTQLFLRHTDDIYNFADLSAVQSRTAEVGVHFYPAAKIQGGLGYILNDYSDGIDTSHNAFAEFNVKPADVWQFGFSYRREDVIENSISLKNEIRKDDLDVRIKVVPHRRLELGADYGREHYSDSNDENIYGIDAAYHILFAPKRLTLRYRYENYGFDHPSINYFSPGSFHVNEVGLEWQHFLNENELFWGSRDTHYTLGYTVNFDVHAQTGHTIYLDFHKDWSDVFTTKIGWVKKIYEHDKTYAENSFLMSGTFFF